LIGKVSCLIILPTAINNVEIGKFRGKTPLPLWIVQIWGLVSWKKGDTRKGVVTAEKAFTTTTSCNQQSRLVAPK
jgi:hypothetical protein